MLLVRRVEVLVVEHVILLLSAVWRWVVVALVAAHSPHVGGVALPQGAGVGVGHWRGRGSLLTSEVEAPLGGHAHVVTAWQADNSSIPAPTTVPTRFHQQGRVICVVVVVVVAVGYK